MKHTMSDWLILLNFLTKYNISKTEENILLLTNKLQGITLTEINLIQAYNEIVAEVYKSKQDKKKKDDDSNIFFDMIGCW